MMRARRRAVAALLILGVAACSAGKLDKVPQGLVGNARIVFADSVLRLDAATALTPYVTGVADRDPATHAWRYTYRVRNDAASTNSIRFFAVGPVTRAPLGITAPAHWMGTRGFDADTSAVVWGVVDAQNPPANWDSVSNYPSIYNIQPGDSATFVMVNTLAPVMVNYYVQGFFYGDTTAESENADDPTVFQNSITGTVLGPGSLVGVTGGVEGAIPGLRSAVPNPSAGSAVFAFYLPTVAQAKIALYDVAGRQIRVVADELFTAGYHSIPWDGRDGSGRAVRAGVYFYRLFIDGRPSGERRLTVVR